MTDSLWDATAEQLLARTASADPTPGGGAVAAIVGALGVGLLRMAARVSLNAAGEGPQTRLEEVEARAGELQLRLAGAADEDTRAFETLMDAYRLPRATAADQARRSAAITSATLGATRTPLAVARAAADGVALADAAEPLVKASIASDVLAGRDVLLGAGLAALHTADINLPALAACGRPEAADLQAQRDALRALLHERRGAA